MENKEGFHFTYSAWIPVPGVSCLCQGKTAHPLPGLCDDLPAYL